MSVKKKNNCIMLTSHSYRKFFDKINNRKSLSCVLYTGIYTRQNFNLIASINFTEITYLLVADL